VALAGLVVLAALSSEAAACPDCDAARAARAAIRVDPDRWLYAAITVLPFVLVAFVVVLLHRIGRPAPPRPLSAPVAAEPALPRSS
jgi:hypothetical protein